MKNWSKIGVLLLFVALVSCNKIKEYNAEKPIVEVNTEKLFLSDIQAILPQNILPEDSAKYADEYIKKWTVRNLLYQKAQGNISSSQEAEIEQLVEGYRRSLIVHLYERKLVEQKVKTPTDDELKSYYETHSNLFRLHDDLFRGIYMRLPKGTPKIDVLRKYFRNVEKNLPEIEKFSYQSATSYEYLDENWVKKSDFSANYPVEIPSTKGLHEASDEQNVYFLYIFDSKNAGDIMPFDFAKQEIVPILQEQNSFNFITKFEEDLYWRALQKGDVVIHKQEENTGKFKIWDFLNFWKE